MKSVMSDVDAIISLYVYKPLKYLYIGGNNDRHIRGYTTEEN
jgi:hypothetical protein